MQSTNNDQYPRAALRVSEACATLSISRSKLYEEVAAGRLRALKAGSRTLIPVASINAWLNNLPTLPEAAKAA
jgi:excisionase family DNA binding protein